MKLTSIFYRYSVFPLIFLLQRLDIYAKFKALHRMEQNHFEDCRDIQRLKYATLINIASKESNHYKCLFAQLPKIYSDISDISILPLLTKRILRDKTAGEIKTACKDYVTRMTAGTTGTPVTVLVDKNALSWQLATRYFLFGWHGINIGDREARFWGRPLQGIGYSIKDLLLNRRRFSFCASTKDELVAEYESLLDYKPDYFYGYSSLILNAAIICKEHGLDVPKLKAIICTAELLGPLQRKYIQDVFKCPVVVEYGCTESDIIAFECEYGTLHVMSHNVFVECNPTSSGMVYTDLNNTAMPLIRYELGDTVEIDANGLCQCNRKLPKITKLEGRTIGQLLTLPDGTTLHAVKFAYLIEDIANKGVDIIQFKIVCEDNKLIFYMNIKGNISLFEKEMSLGVDKIVEGKMGYSFVYGEIKSDMNKKFSYFENKL